MGFHGIKEFAEKTFSKKKEYEKEETEKEVEVKHQIKVRINKVVEDKINWLTKNYTDEISAFLTGEIKDNEIIIDGLLFPHQDVSGGSVEVEPKNLIKLRKEYGDECLRIIGHWHSHNNMGAFWSVTDDTFIENYSRTKDISIYFVSSTLGRCKVMLVVNKPFKIKFDNLEYETIWDSEEFEGDLKKMIEEKVTKKTFAKTNKDYSGYYGEYGRNRDVYDYQTNLTDSKKTIEDEIKHRVKESIKFNTLSNTITIKHLDFIQSDTLSRDTKEYNPEVKRLNEEDFIVVYESKNKEGAIKILKDLRFYLNDIFEEEINIREYQDPNYYWG